MVLSLFLNRRHGSVTPIGEGLSRPTSTTSVLSLPDSEAEVDETKIVSIPKLPIGSSSERTATSNNDVSGVQEKSMSQNIRVISANKSSGPKNLGPGKTTTPTTASPPVVTKRPPLPPSSRKVCTKTLDK